MLMAFLVRLAHLKAVYILNSVYPKQSGSKVVLKDVLLAFNELKQTYRYELADYLAKKKNLKSYGGTWAHSLRHHLDILKRANIISVEKQRFHPKKSFGTTVRKFIGLTRMLKGGECLKGV